MCYSLPLRSLLAALCVSVLLTGTYSQTADSASLHGSVRDAQGKAVANAEVRLQSRSSSQIQTVHSDAQGNYLFSGLQQGVYSLRVVSESRNAEISALFLSRNESKTADLTLDSAKTSPSAADSPKFFDEPHFTVSGVTDTTSLGGHGSDTIVRTRETLAKEAASLGKASENHTDQTSDVQKSLRAAADQNPGSFNANYLFGRFLVENGSPMEAVRYLEAAVKAQPSPDSVQLAEVHHDLAQAEEELGDSLKAVGEYQRAAELSATEPYFFDWGSELLLHHAPEPAIEVFSKGNHLFPRSARMLIGLGAAWFTHGDASMATGKIVAASDLAPNDPAPYLFLGKMQAAESAASPEIVDRLRRFATLQPESPQANYYYAVALGKLHTTSSEKVPLAEIESSLNKAVSLDPKFAPAYLQLGILHSQQGDDAAAIASYQRAIQSDPELEEAHYRLAQAYRLAGNPGKAKQELQIYEQLSKESAQRIERERHEIRQFVYTLRDPPAGQNP